MSFLVTEENKLKVFCPSEYRFVLENLGGKKTKDGSWVVNFTSFNVNRLKEKIKGLEIFPSVQEDIAEMERYEATLEDIREKSRSNETIKFRVPSLTISPYDYQKWGIRFLSLAKTCILGDDMGVGKTMQAIGTACLLKSRGLIKNCLIVAPSSLKWNWPIEIAKFTQETFVVINGLDKKRIPQWKREDVFFTVVSYDTVSEDLFGGRSINIKEGDSEETAQRKLASYEKKMAKKGALREVAKRGWDMIVIDEAHAIKNHDSARHKNIVELGAKSKYRFALTGTPIDGRLEELHGIFQFVEPNLFQHKKFFLERHTIVDFFGAVIGYKGLEEVSERIKPFFLRRLKEQVLPQLPEVVYENVWVELSAAERKLYESIKEGEHSIVEGHSAMVRALRAKQVCSHPSLIGEGGVRPSKLLSFLDIIEELVLSNKKKVIVFSQYHEVNKILIDEVEKIGVKYLYIWGGTEAKDRADYQKLFNEDDSIQIIFGTEAMAEGFNLTSASYVINYDDSWSPSKMRQREARALRIGQKNSVTAVNFICKNTIEERVREVLANKGRLASDVLEDGTDEAILQRLSPNEIMSLL